MRVAPETKGIDEMTKSLSNENVKREALKLRDMLLKYDRKEDANYLEQHVAELGDPNTVEDALWSLKGMCHPNWLGDVCGHTEAGSLSALGIYV